MKIHILKCPACDGELEVKDGLDMFFCKYCGHKIILDGQSDAAYKAKTWVKGMEFIERMADKRHEREMLRIQEENERRKESSTSLNIIAVVALLIIFGVLIVNNLESNAMEKELQQIVDEIQIDVETGNFDKAYIKAQSIKYTQSGNREVKEKWEKTRKEVIVQIIEAEKKATGTTTHEPEKD